MQRATAEDPSDSEQVALIREHLEEEAARFAQGDFGDPASIHGDDMPGPAELRVGGSDIDIQFKHLSLMHDERLLRRWRRTRSRFSRACGIASNSRSG